MEFSHRSVLLLPAVEGLAVRADGVYVDGTAGGGGHSYEIAKRLTAGGRLIAIDRDAEAVEAAKERLREFGDRVIVVRDCFGRMDKVLSDLAITGVDGILLDLGVSSHQFDDAERGFSYKNEARVDMRMDNTRGISACEVVNTYPRQELTRIFYEYGEEKFSARIAQRICAARAEKEIVTTTELAQIIKDAIPAAARSSEKGHPAKRCFQALRIEVNDELGELARGLEVGWSCLHKGGRMSVITFHSLEDRAVKRFNKEKITACICPKEFPVCVCGHRAEGRLITAKPIVPDDSELRENPRSASAKLRVIEKIV